MFGDLDWPINASRRFVSIILASCSTTALQTVLRQR